ncbi:phage terminase large subunit family protein [Bartonella ancashensis]|uniref:Phage terminase, large subunit n=1 Tax=Bartonella ancashensis TaxID=1318743 RepID=A0A0M3T2K1_9HYPH|nr:phage terminase large subunit family protein [Bartonella ancashensis]ALE02875.1 Phage terminase, large subunit [Bartonella ancashensis]
MTENVFNMLSGAELFFAHANEARRPDPPYTVSEWADKNRYLNTVASAETGLWRTKRTPYLREIMDCLSSYVPIETTIVMKGAQVGMSEAGLNFCGYAIHHSPGPALYVMPTVETAKKLSKLRLDPMIKASPALGERIAPARARDSGNTMFSKEFDGGTLMLTGANSAAGLRSVPIRYLILDEVDSYPLNVDNEGDPVTLAERRTSTFVQRKIFKLSTPTHRDTSRIAKDFALGDQRYYNVPCDGCGTLQPIVWGQIKWPQGAPEQAVFVCVHCGHAHAEHRKSDLMAEEKGACWVATKESSRPNLRSYHISALYSPWLTWGECAREFLNAKDDPALLQPFVNTVLGEPWEDRSGEVVDPDSLYAQREDYSLAPSQAVLLTAGIDVQNDRLELEVVAWGRGEESWNIDYQVIPGDPSSIEIWEQLDAYLSKTWPHPGYKNGIRITAACIDTGGSHTQAVYNYIRPREGRRIWGVKGHAGSRPVWPRRPSRNNKGQINLYIIGVDAAKDIITARFKKSGPEVSGSGATHFHMNLDKEYFEQLTSERKVIKYFKGFKRIEWQKSEKARNEALDCRVYAYAALQGLISAGLNLNREVDILEERLEKLKSVETSSEHSALEQSPKIAQRIKPPKKQYKMSISPYLRGDWWMNE